MVDSAEDRRRRRADRLDKAEPKPDRFVPTPKPPKAERVGVADSQAYQLFSLITDATEDNGWSGGLTRFELQEIMGITKNRFHEVFFFMRRSLGSDASRVVPIQDPDGQFRYRACDDPAAAEQWVTRQKQTLVTKLETVAIVLNSLVTLTDGRTIEGKRYRLSHRAVQQALDVLTLVDDLEAVR